jgi:hypothetical protein
MWERELRWLLAIRQVGRNWLAGQGVSSAETSGGRDMKSYLQLLIALTTVIWVGVATASETKVVISLSEQRAYLIE